MKSPCRFQPCRKQEWKPLSGKEGKTQGLWRKESLLTLSTVNIIRKRQNSITHYRRALIRPKNNSLFPLPKSRDIPLRLARKALRPSGNEAYCKSWRKPKKGRGMRPLPSSSNHRVEAADLVTLRFLNLLWTHYTIDSLLPIRPFARIPTFALSSASAQRPRSASNKHWIPCVYLLLSVCLYRSAPCQTYFMLHRYGIAKLKISWRSSRSSKNSHLLNIARHMP